MSIFDSDIIFLIVLLTTAASIAYFIMISYIITQLDTRYFLHKYIASKPINPNKTADDGIGKKTHETLLSRSVSYLVNMAKIMIGVCLLVCGIMMLILPGQGLLTMLIGLSLIPFPGKNKFEQRILSRKAVRTSLNWIRKKANKAPFIFD